MPETERRFYQRLRDTPKVKGHDSNKEGRGFKEIRLKTSDQPLSEGTQTQLTATTIIADIAEEREQDKTPSSAQMKSQCDQKPAVPPLEESTLPKTRTSLKNELIHYQPLPPSEPHHCDKYGCPREAKYRLGTAISATIKQ